MGKDSAGPKDFRVEYMDTGGASILIITIRAETLTSANDLAAEVALEVGKANFFLTAMPDIVPAVARSAFAPPKATELLASMRRLLHAHAKGI